MTRFLGQSPPMEATDFFIAAEYTVGTTFVGRYGVGYYLTVVMILNIMVHFLLLLATNRLTGYPQCVARCLLGAGIGGVYGAVCMLPVLHFLGNILWRCGFLCVMGLAAYGISKSGIQRCMLFLLLNMAMGGIASGAGTGGIWSAIAGGVIFCVAGYLGLCTLATRQEYVEVELRKGEKQEKLLALRDTGNTLRDPVSGQSVLVADARSADALLGLSRQQLRSPVETVASGVVQGLRLIPYRAVGQPGGMLVAIRLEQVRIGSWQGSAVVAFAPDGLGEENTYRALTGGIL